MSNTVKKFEATVTAPDDFIDKPTYWDDGRTEVEGHLFELVNDAGTKRSWFVWKSDDHAGDEGWDAHSSGQHDYAKFVRQHVAADATDAWLVYSTDLQHITRHREVPLPGQAAKPVQRLKAKLKGGYARDYSEVVGWAFQDPQGQSRMNTYLFIYSADEYKKGLKDGYKNPGDLGWRLKVYLQGGERFDPNGSTRTQMLTSLKKFIPDDVEYGIVLGGDDIEILSAASGGKTISHYPHKCNLCSNDAYVNGARTDCSYSGCANFGRAF